MKNRSYRYMSFGTPQGVGRATFAFAWEKADDNNSPTGKVLRFQAGAAFCNPKDNFRKDMGRGMADAKQAGRRISSEGCSVTGVVPCSDTSNVSHEEFEAVASVILAKAANTPMWAIRSHRRGDAWHGLR